MVLSKDKIKVSKPLTEKKDEDWAEGIVYVDDPRIPQEFLRKIDENAV